MNILFSFMCLVPSSVDTLWVVDFSSQPAGWIAGPFWEHLEDCIYLEIDAGGVPYGYDSEEDSLLSPEFIVPESADSLVLVFDHYWWGYGICWIAPPEYAQSTSTLEMYGPDISSGPIELWEVYGYCGYPDCLFASPTDGETYSVTDSGSVFIPLNDVSTGDTLSFVFRGLVESYTDYMAGLAYIEWSLYTFCILNYTEVSLERSTWGSIKALF